MIVVTRLNGRRIAVNPDLVERLHESPDTTLVLVTGVSLVVTEPLEEIVERIVDFRARVVARAGDRTPGSADGGRWTPPAAPAEPVSIADHARSRGY